MASTADAGGKYETVEMDDKTSADEVTEESTTVTVTTTAEHRRKQPFAAMQQGMQKGATQTVAVVSGAFSDFVRFLKRGNVFDLAVGVVMGSAFTAIVNSFVSDLITPIIALAIQSNLEHAFIVIRCKTFPNNSTKVDPTCTEGNQANYTTVAVANAAGAVTWNWGNFIQICINFLVTGFFVYILVKAYSATFLPAILAPPGPKMRNCEFCLESINAKAKKCKFCTSPNEVQVEVVAVETSPFANLRFPRVPHMTDVFHKKAASSSSGGSGSPGGPGPSGGTPMMLGRRIASTAAAVQRRLLPSGARVESLLVRTHPCGSPCRCVASLPPRAWGSATRFSSSSSRSLNTDTLSIDRSSKQTMPVMTAGASIPRPSSTAKVELKPSLADQTITQADGTTITTLPNGLRVASMDVPGHFVSFGVFVTTGTRYESDKLAGVTHVMDRMAFKSTENMTAEKLVAAIETVGGSVMAHSARESIVYQASVFPKDVPRIAEIFSDVIRRPRFLPEELDDVKDAVRFEVADSQFKMDLLLPERVHEIAYGGVAASPSKLMNGWQSLFGLGNGAAASQPTLGRPMMCALDRLETMTVDHLREYHSTWYTPDRLIVVCVGMPHEDVLRVVVPTFGDMAPTRPEVRALQQNMTHRAVYKGGIVINDTTEEAKSPNPDDRLLTHVYVGFEAPGVLDPDVYAIATLAQLMGGGGSFSAGGPGKGMYSRLYTQVLNRNHWIDRCNSFSFTYDDTGLFGISAAIPPDAATHSHVLPIIFDQLVRMCDGYTDLEVSRAKNQLKSNVLMALESRGVELEDIGKQVMSLGRRVSAVETCERIDAVTGADLVRVAMRMVAGLDVPSPFVFKDGMKREQWKPAAPGKATVLIHGPVGAKDPLMKVETTMREWGLQV